MSLLSKLAQRFNQPENEDNVISFVEKLQHNNQHLQAKILIMEKNEIGFMDQQETMYKQILELNHQKQQLITQLNTQITQAGISLIKKDAQMQQLYKEDRQLQQALVSQINQELVHTNLVIQDKKKMEQLRAQEMTNATHKITTQFNCEIERLSKQMQLMQRRVLELEFERHNLQNQLNSQLQRHEQAIITIKTDKLSIVQELLREKADIQRTLNRTMTLMDQKCQRSREGTLHNSGNGDVALVNK